MKPESALKRFTAFLREKGLRLTQPRSDILMMAWSTHDHFTADQMVAWLTEMDGKASRATVYRTLSLLVEGGFLSSMDNGQGTLLYEHILGHAHHDHMVCLGCSRIIEFRSEEIESLQEELAARHQFQLVDHTLRLEGYCASCQRQRNDA
jgi:Fur family ferric uptake transcriptional regulator